MAPRPLSHQRLRLYWCLGCGVIITSSVAELEGITLSQGRSPQLPTATPGSTHS